ncbi:MAG: transaldolase [Pelagibacteraceae bacterium]|nr:transaldolase [Pelagibacteraceae bacterium]
MTNKLENLKKYSSIVADTGNIDSIKKFSPEDCTTNPSLIYKAVESKKYQSIVNKVIDLSSSRTFNSKIEKTDFIVDQLAISFGIELSKIVPGYISTEVNADLSFDSKATIEKAQQIINSYEESGVKKNRVLIKIAGTWEGIQAVKQLEAMGISCNCTLIFSLTQAVACAEAGAFLISPFVGRILDWFKLNTKVEFNKDNDPGVESVKKIFQYFKKYKLNTIVMAASFRSISQIIELAGCDKLTISPVLLDELMNLKGDVDLKLKPEDSTSIDIPRLSINESAFRWHLNENQMASFKLAEGIRLFNKDLSKLRNLIIKQL